MPASLLPFKEQWQEIANGLPNNQILIITPSTDSASKKILEKVGSLLATKGRLVTTISAEQFR